MIYFFEEILIFILTKKEVLLLEKFVITGGNRLKGEVNISGAKNAAVAILPAVLLADSPCVLENVPNIRDVAIILKMLKEMGASIKLINKSTVEIDATRITSPVVSYDMAKDIRASYYFLGSMLAKFNKASVTMPGGCYFGVRPIDQHLKGFNALGAKDNVEHGMINVEAEKLIGNHIYFDVVTVGATINVMLAAVKAHGLTIIENAAREPHIVDLANFLNSMGAKIMGAGTDVIKIHGVSSLTGATYSIIPDQIEAGTYMAATVATRGDVLIKNVIPKHLESISNKFKKMGAEITEFDDSLRVSVPDKVSKISVKTHPHPGFPTDMQPQIAATLVTADGTSIVTEGVWDNRFQYVDELKRMGADISVEGKIAVIEGCAGLTGAPVKATDLRAGAALVIAALSAKGTTEIEEVFRIERGYEEIIDKLTALGADIKKITTPSEIAEAL